MRVSILSSIWSPSHQLWMFFKLIICVVILKEVAEQQGNLDESQTLQSELEELEERAQELDKIRSRGLSAIR